MFVGPGQADSGDAATLSASLTVALAKGSAALAGRSVTITYQSEPAITAITDATGTARATVSLGPISGTAQNPVQLAFAGQSSEIAAATGQGAVNVVADETTLTFTTATPSFAIRGQAFIGVAIVTDPSGSPRPGEVCSQTAPAPAWCTLSISIVDTSGTTMAVASGPLDASGRASIDLGSLTFAAGSYQLVAVFQAGGAFAGAYAAMPFQLLLGAPSLAAISPTSAPTAGGTSLVVTGSAFGNVTAVSFGCFELVASVQACSGSIPANRMPGTITQPPSPTIFFTDATSRGDTTTPCNPDPTAIRASLATSLWRPTSPRRPTALP